MRRREFLGVVGGAVATWPLAARAQQAMPVIGFLSSLGRNDRTVLGDAFRRGLNEAGYADGRNVTVEYRFAENRYELLPTLAAELVARKVSVIAATGGGHTIAAAKAATTAIPVVFTFGGDPVQEGFVGGLNRPGGNVTGVSFFASVLSAKGLGLLVDIAPQAQLIGVLINSRNPESVTARVGAGEAARALGRQVLVMDATIPEEIDVAFATMRQRGVSALLVGGDPYFTARRQQIIALAARDAIPAMYVNREFVSDGGLMSYGTDVPDAYRRAALVVARILKGEKPADIPIDQATRFDFVINRKTAKALGIEIPTRLLATADEVIE
jgi:putative tryptophan/tyrosine transport system substrate-binding protein